MNKHINAVILAIFLASCGAKEPSSTPAAQSNDTSANPTLEGFKSGFMSSCKNSFTEKSGNTFPETKVTDMCSCLYDNVFVDLTEKEALAISMKAMTGNIPSEILEKTKQATPACMQKTILAK